VRCRGGGGCGGSGAAGRARRRARRRRALAAGGAAAASVPPTPTGQGAGWPWPGGSHTHTTAAPRTCARPAEGVLYAEKDFNLAKHPEIDVPNLHVIKLMQSFKSKELVKERFAWRHYYW
jgi:hypothetical protein